MTVRADKAFEKTADRRTHASRYATFQRISSIVYSKADEMDGLLL